ncbi:hypothetical protein DPMN_062340 [Dreissena polymorpha]|uniref:Secreted protein n=1 Tax=Dreissena polymorpha TaxID=45954 RepID=A0A9D4C9N6_DREPO|nr:hypothetical protein DPMN_062295 [Dreissena polymorpha]KAH3719503.1 hypothetical protein DPMN_062340 [Dreissena polymorpha]
MWLVEGFAAFMTILTVLGCRLKPLESLPRHIEPSINLIEPPSSRNGPHFCPAFYLYSRPFYDPPSDYGSYEDYALTCIIH